MSWTCPKCDRELPWDDYRHYCQRVSLDSLFEGRSELTGKDNLPFGNRLRTFSGRMA